MQLKNVGSYRGAEKSNNVAEISLAEQDLFARDKKRCPTLVTAGPQDEQQRVVQADELRSFRQRDLIADDLLNDAQASRGALRQIVDDPNVSPRTKISAARALLGAAGFGAHILKVQKAREKDLSEMTRDELRMKIEQAYDELAKRAKNVTPNAEQPANTGQSSDLY